ncbi:MAG: signal recognition particle-docking protein FtsY [Kangiellaceae bacterium]|nr:signal recognition particle-docking protein FtsY [Kangiellaceae bacterium]
MSEKKKGGLFGFFRKKSSQPDITESSEQALEQAEEAIEQELDQEVAEEIEQATEHSDKIEAEIDTVDATQEVAHSEIKPEIAPEHQEFEQAVEQLNQQLSEQITISIADKEAQQQPQVEPSSVQEPETETRQETVQSEGLLAPIADEPQVTETHTEAEPSIVQQPVEKKGFFARLKDGLSKTRSQLTSGIADLVLGSKQIDDDLLEEIETQLLMADVGVEATRKIIDDLTDKAERKELKDPQSLMDRLRELLSNIVSPCSNQLILDKKPFVILMVGVNGVGKTTTIGKLAKKFQSEGKSVMLAAGDTFRAAAVEQLQVWGERNNIHVTAQHTGADSASVIFDSLQAAQARDIDVLIADTAGRLHTKSNLMDELAKVKRVMQKIDPSAPHEIMLVVDAGTGQNALNQATEFHKAVGLTGITITKLDGTAKGGVIFALADKLQVPIRFIGVGEGIDDLREFDANDFINALFSNE